MKYRALLSIIGAFGCGFFINSCSLPTVKHRVAFGPELDETQRYELRKGMNPDQAFTPGMLRSVYFVLKPDAAPSIAGTRSGTNGILSVRTTAYCHSEADHLAYGNKSAVGKKLKYGAIRSAAADWSRFPLGTRFKIKSQPGVIYEIDDYGSALVGSNTIDIYCPTRRSMNSWGVKHLDIEVLTWGSFDASVNLMKDRMHYPHVRKMVRDIRSRTGTALIDEPTQSKPSTRKSPLLGLAPAIELDSASEFRL
jgi:3D (Asp-Asp-Asp) domain-containing protein